jgi:pimeloyl-ACP methyl ester carboxylesterase
MEPTIRRIPASDGITLNALEWSTEGTPMLLLHGFSNEAHIWDDFAPIVAPYYRVIALDLRGHGDSDWHPDARYDYADHADDLEAVYASLGIERAVLVAHSLGGRIAMLFAGAHPDKVAGLVIVDSAPELDVRGTTRISLDTAQHRDPSFASTSEYEQMLVHGYPEATPAAIARMARHGIKQREDGRYVLKMDVAFRGVVSGDAGEIDRDALEAHHLEMKDKMWGALEKIPCPTLVVRGAASDIVSADVADRMVEDVLPKGTLAVVARAGHSVMTDNPEGFNEAVSRFVLGE